jgi:Domain of unknown function (DUF4476)
MKLKFTFFFLMAFAPLFSWGQGVITIFSEDGDKFYLVMNGVQQNATPQTNVRVDGLTNDFYNSKIIFEDKTKPEISKNLPTKDAGSGQFVEWTFKIKKMKDGDLKLRAFGSAPVPVNYNPPPDVYVMHYGQPAPPATTVTQTSVTTTNMNAGNNGGASVSINAGGAGVNMSVNIADPTLNSGVSTQTTTTRTTTYSQTSSSSYDNSQPVAAGCQYPMDWGSFKSAKATVEQASFEDTKLSTAKSILASNCVSSEQVVQLCNLFGFEETKLNFAKFAYSKATDPGNYFKVNNVFGFDASKTDLNNFISAHQK